MFSPSNDTSTGKRSDLAQRRVYALIAIGLACAVIVIVSVAAPITVYQKHDNSAREERWKLEISEADKWTASFRASTVDVIAAVRGFKGLVRGLVNSTPPFNGTVTDRTKNQWLGRFSELASWFHSTTEFASAFLLAPGGVVLQSYPSNSEVEMFDFLAYGNELGFSSVLQSIDRAQVDFLGPLLHGIPHINVQWQLVVRDPIYIASDVKNASRENFWGFAVSVQDVIAIMEANEFDKSARSKGLDYLIYTMEGTNHTIVSVLFSLMAEPTIGDLKQFIQTGTNRAVLRHHLSWYVCLRSNHTEMKLTKTVIVFIVVFTLLGTLALFLIASSLVLVWMREYNGRNHAPKMAPFAMAIIGPCGGEQLWDLAPDQMLKVSEQLAELQRREIVRHRVYEGIQLHPYTTTIITRNVSTAVQICFSVLEEMQSQEIDAPLRRLLGDDGRLFVACAVHWCRDARVSMDGINGNLRYEGPDVIYGGRLWMFAAPNAVSISSVTLDAVKTMADTEIHPLGSVFIRGVAERQNLYIITKPASKWLKKASEVAKDCMTSSLMELPLYNVSLTTANNPLTSGPGRPKQGNHACSHIDTRWTSDSDSSVRVHCKPSVKGTSPLNDSKRCRASEKLHNTKQRNHVNVPIAMNGVADTDSVPFIEVLQNIESRSSNFNSSDDEAVAASPKMRERRANGDGDGDHVTDVLLHPKIHTSVDMHLRTVFEQQTVILDISYDSVRTIIFFFFSAFKLLLKPLATPERSNIFQRLATAFGVPQHNILEHLAVRCALRYIQQITDMCFPLWNGDQQRRLQLVAGHHGGMPRENWGSSSTSTPLVGESSGPLSQHFDT